MKELNKYIVEKLKINKDTQNDSIIKSLDELYSDYGKYLKEKKLLFAGSYVIAVKDKYLSDNIIDFITIEDFSQYSNSDFVKYLCNSAIADLDKTDKKLSEQCRIDFSYNWGAPIPGPIIRPGFGISSDWGWLKIGNNKGNAEFIIKENDNVSYDINDFNKIIYTIIGCIINKCLNK